MTKAEFFVELQDMLQRDDEIKENDLLADYEEWDSLSKMSVMAYYNKNFGIRLSFTDMKSFETVADLIAKAGDKVQG